MLLSDDIISQEGVIVMAYKNYDSLTDEEKEKIRQDREDRINEIKDSVANKIREGLKNDVPIWKQEWMKNAMSKMPHNGRTGYEYTGWSNIIIALVVQDMKGYSSGRWYSGADVAMIRKQTKKGFPHIKKDEQCIYMTAFIPFTKEQIEKKRLKREKILGRPVDVKEMERGYFKGFSVFNADQIADLPPVKEKKIEHTGEMTKEKEAALDKLIDDYCKSEGIPFGHTGKNGNWSDRAYYNHKDDFIVVPPKDKFNTLAAYYSTVFHEMAHSTGGSKRLDRIGKKDNRYAQEELVAEVTACMLCAKYDIEPDMTFKNSLGYLQSWASGIGNDRDWLFDTMEKATKAISLVVEYENKELKQIRSPKVKEGKQIETETKEIKKENGITK